MVNQVTVSTIRSDATSELLLIIRTSRELVIDDRLYNLKIIHLEILKVNSMHCLKKHPVLLRQCCRSGIYPVAS